MQQFSIWKGQSHTPVRGSAQKPFIVKLQGLKDHIHRQTHPRADTLGHVWAMEIGWQEFRHTASGAQTGSDGAKVNHNEYTGGHSRGEARQCQREKVILRIAKVCCTL